MLLACLFGCLRVVFACFFGCLGCSHSCWSAGFFWAIPGSFSGGVGLRDRISGSSALVAALGWIHLWLKIKRSEGLIPRVLVHPLTRVTHFWNSGF